ncbi:CLUMA_CG008776, isoform A [Clunio marinus]|uniref:CLUMA_CG008776, isoform A n=1 Tax=Clunio marinus TaxID=568069 RepID=A0A1J1I8Q4_9DIPT|nr:CLUMA_CG008776, isoform A [Clunio marinus]
MTRVLMEIVFCVREKRLSDNFHFHQLLQIFVVSTSLIPRLINVSFDSLQPEMCPLTRKQRMVKEFNGRMKEFLNPQEKRRETKEQLNNECSV